MPVNPASEERKQKVVTLVKQRVGPLVRNHPRRHDWHSASDGSVDIFVTDSKAHHDERPWFDMRDDDLKQLAAHPAGFIIFILGDETSYLVVPARDLMAQLPNHREGLLETGFYHFNTVLGRGARVFKQLPDWDVSPYVRKIELIPEKAANKPMQPTPR